MKGVLLLFLALEMALLVAPVSGRTFDSAAKVIGDSGTYLVKPGDSLVEIARIFGLGFNELADANPGIDPFVPVPGTMLVIPTSWVVPDAEPTVDLLINVSELRLYYFFFDSAGKRRVVTFPVGIGSEGNDTPLGFYRVKEKKEAPSWRVPPSIREEQPELPEVVPPGPENPLGTHALRLSRMSILIHGTNRPWGVGRRASHGCLRLYPEDIPRLYDKVRIEDGVIIVRQPVKVGELKGRVFVEVHDDPAEEDYLNHLVHLLAKKELTEKVSLEKLFRALAEKRGVPVDVTE
ncbi:L,D-transpeptidase family protein [Geobacter sp. DSM 9736]|uniref:L,D-transpeptidase family protein n=1 Tax=Geobacter sp. DSM 9736 TaxID=1277350 RepID=UPI000B50EAE7|nr:L,D-transpeptidase family protein [Geobacter sp. DSM 9736]SNB46718.1 L,D-transpeptidase ErfK/SrfK [Geobacter sp. DSM 9736]